MHHTATRNYYYFLENSFAAASLAPMSTDSRPSSNCFYSSFRQSKVGVSVLLVLLLICDINVSESPEIFKRLQERLYQDAPNEDCQLGVPWKHLFLLRQGLKQRKRKSTSEIWMKHGTNFYLSTLLLRLEEPMALFN